jgi:NADH dehydrogenase
VFPNRSVEVYYGGIDDLDALDEAHHGVDAVIHLVAIIREYRRQRRKVTFDAVNRQGTANVASVAKENGVKHFIHVSANGATKDPGYKYLYSKFQGEQEVITSGLPYTIFRPTLMYGPGDEFVNALAGLARLSPIVPVAGPGRNRFQPIEVDDVARCLAMSVNQGNLKGRTLEIGGPEQLSYNQMANMVARTMGTRRWFLHVPFWSAKVAVSVMQVLQPRPPVTTEMLGMMSLRNVSEFGVVEQTFGFTPKRMEDNIEFVKSITRGDGVRTALGLPPSSPRGR